MDYQFVEKDGLSWLRFAHIEAPHAVSTRRGGVSEGPYQGLNLGKMSGDDLGRVAENRRLFGEALGFPIHQTLSMVHGNDVAVLESPGDLAQVRQGDACVAAHPDVTLSITTADCVPIVYYDPSSRAVGLAHAGWKGTLARVAATTVEALQERFGARPEELRVGIGPAILRCCFEVDHTVAEQFRPLGVSYPRGDKWEVDLHEANRQVLLEAGVRPHHLRVCSLCTSCRPDLFYSYRRDRQVTGRLLTAIAAGA